MAASSSIPLVEEVPHIFAPCVSFVGDMLSLSKYSTTAGGERMCYPRDGRGASGGMRKLNVCMCRIPHASWGLFLQDAIRRKALELVAMDRIFDVFYIKMMGGYLHDTNQAWKY